MLARGGALSGGSTGFRGRTATDELLDKERKEELILAKQVRQGTVVILGGNMVRVSP